MSNDLGIDRSGNGNNWTVNNINSTDQMLDTPTNNFAVMNPLRPNCSTAFREGNLYLRDSGSVMGVSTILPETGKWYWEVDPQDRYAGSPQYGIATENINNETEVGSNLDGVKIVAYSGGNDISLHGTGTLHGSTGPWPSDHIWGFALDNDNGKLWISRDGDWTHVLSGGNPSTATNPTASGLPTGYPIFGNIGSASTTYNAYIRVNFGADGTFFGNQTSGGYSDDNGYGDFKYEPPTGFLALCTKNLPEPDVKPQEHFNTVLYTGSGNAQSITGLGLTPDMTWIKSRSNANSHVIHDNVRSTNGTAYLLPDLNTAEQTGANGFVSLDSDGFSLNNAGGGGEVNGSGRTYVAWNWKANGSGSSNTDGDVTSTVSANVDAGFSIVTYTGNGSNINVGHGLSKAPEIVIVKVRNETGGWYINLKNIPSQSAGVDMVGALNTSDAINGMNVGQWYFGSTAPTSSVFRVQNKDDVGENGDTHVAYCFHSVDGYSSIGSYVGNGNADGTFVYTGFRVKWLLVRRTDGSADWLIFDAERNTFNVVDKFLEPNTSDAEATESTSGYEIDFDFTSNGFKLRGPAGGINNNGSNYIYMAFAETPFKYSNAR